jgi:hypothetical protein
VESAAEGGQRQWGSMAALAAVVLFLPVLEAFSLVALSLAVLLLALPPRQFRSSAFAVALLAWVFLLFPVAGTWNLMGRGWALMVAGLFAITALLWPRWGFFSRALAATATAGAAVGVWLWISGAWGEVNWTMAEHFRSMSLLTTGSIASRVPDAKWAADLMTVTAAYAEWQGKVFPALLGLQSLAALGLAWWAFERLAARRGRWQPLRPLREFRFNDQLVWVVIAGLLLILLPLGAAAVRAGLNALLFMGGLYALRGVAVFVFLAGGAPSLLSVVFGALAAVFLYPLVLTAALLVGLGDTWLDVRGRATLAARG